jgi:hypothetical protein
MTGATRRPLADGRNTISTTYCPWNTAGQTTSGTWCPLKERLTSYSTLFGKVFMDYDVRTLLNSVRANWSQPRVPVHRGVPSPPEVVCTITDLVSEPRPELRILPAGLRAFWTFYECALLFYDSIYGQWGLCLASFARAYELTAEFKMARENRYVAGDLVVGEFYGDSDLLIVRTDVHACDFGAVIIALPIDTREEWYRPASSFESFLTEYILKEGDKFWEPPYCKTP